MSQPTMTGFSQAELDSLCACSEAPVDEPSSPIGTALLARKRQRQFRPSKDASSQEVDVPFAMTLSGSSAGDCGFTQASLDEMSVEAPPSQDLVDSSPIGASLRRAKNRRRRFVPLTMPEEPQVEKPAQALPRCFPASWGNGGLSQAELDAMCDENKSGYHHQLSGEDASSPMFKAASPPVQISPKPQAASPVMGSPARRRRTGSKRDAENAGGKAGSVSPSKVKDMSSPGLREMPSPQRRSPCLSPLSPVGLN